MLRVALLSLLCLVSAVRETSAGWTGVETFNSATASSYPQGSNIAGDKGSWNVVSANGFFIQADSSACFTETRAVFALGAGGGLDSPTIAGGIGRVTFIARGTIASITTFPSNTTYNVGAVGGCTGYSVDVNSPTDTVIRFNFLNGGVLDNVGVSDYPPPGPTVTEFFAANATFTNAGTVNYVLRFSEAVSGVSAANFSLNQTGVVGAAIGTVTGSATEWTIPIGTGSGDGTVGLSFANATGIAPTPSTVLPLAAGGIYTIDKSPPTVSTFTVDSAESVANPFTGTYAFTGTGAAGVTAFFYWRREDSPDWNGGTFFASSPWMFTPPEGSGVYRFEMVAGDVLGNREPAPLSGSSGRIAVVFNELANGPLARIIPAGDGIYDFPLAATPDSSLRIEIEGVAAPGTVTVSRFLTDAAPKGYNPADLIDQQIVIQASPEFSFIDATLFYEYNPEQLDGVPEEQLTLALRDDGTTVTEFSATVDAVANTITVPSVDGFSTWSFGRAAVRPEHWILY